MTDAHGSLTIAIAAHRWKVGARAFDLSIPLAFDAPQPVFFGVPAAHEQTVAAGTFIGDVRRGGSCNCSTYTITPHCNGTHTECVGHITSERLSVRELCRAAFNLALLISVPVTPASASAESSDPQPLPSDFLITRAAIQSAVEQAKFESFDALIVRTLPNDAAKRSRNYDGEPAPFFSAEAMRWIVERNVQHLVVDTPSVDRAHDQGRLCAHRIFWNVPAGATSVDRDVRRHATITELAFIDDEAADGPYLLNLQVAPFEADAAPSRPILLPLSPA